jgi:hypothetical protein
MLLHALEGNPRNADDIAMFEMFEGEAWSHERCGTYLTERARMIAGTSAAE